MQLSKSPLGVLRSIRPSLAGLTILDIGCGTGGLVRELLAQGADATGIDPGPEAIRKARIDAPQADFVAGSAEALPFEDASFDIAVMVNSLHHVPEASMDLALSEAIRVVRPEGAFVILEPLARGSFFEAMRRVEDETVVRASAQRAISRAISASVVRRNAVMDYDREDFFPNVRSFLEFLVAVDPARQATVDANLDAITANVLDAAQRTEDGRLSFIQPMKVDILGHP